MNSKGGQRIIPDTHRWLRFVTNDSGVTFIEVIVTLVMIVAAVIVTIQSLYVGKRALDHNMHEMQVMRIVQGELEFWVGRMYVNQRENADDPFPSDAQMLGSERRPYRTVLLDPESPNPIVVSIYYQPIDPRLSPDIVNNIGEPIVAYYSITVWAEWVEPDGTFKDIQLTTYSQRPG